MRKVVVTVCAGLLLSSLWISAYAFPAKSHNTHLEIALLGKNGRQMLDEKAADMFRALECASYLCIDQYNNNGSNELKFLFEMQKEYWFAFLPTVGRYPETIAEIDFTSNFAHRQYTHVGWEVDKEPTEDQIYSHWPLRQTLLRATVEAVFDFNDRPFSSSSSTGEHLCKLIYYIHILGDHIAFTDYSNYDSGKANIYPLGGKDNGTVICELTETLKALFDTQASELIRELQTIDMEFRSIVNEGISEANFGQYHNCAQAVLDALGTKLPGLLKKQPYFNEVFY